MANAATKWLVVLAQTWATWARFPDPLGAFAHALMLRDPTARLGAGGGDEVRRHAFLAEVEWPLLQAKRLVAPFVPSAQLVYCKDEVPGHDEDAPGSAPEAPPIDGWEYTCSGAAYADELQPYHKWLLRSTFTISISHAPGYTDLALAIGPGLGDEERDHVINGEIYEFLRAGEPLVKALEATYANLQIEDVRKC